MYNKTAHQRYTTAHVSTVDRGRLLLMLYDGCIKFLKHAKIGLEKKDIVKFATYLSKSQAIIAELMLTLDFERGGDVAKDLDRLYDFMLFYLTEANLEKDPEKVQRVINLIEVIAKAYREVIDKGEYRKEIGDAAASAVNSARKQSQLPPAARKSGDDAKGSSLSISL